MALLNSQSILKTSHSETNQLNALYSLGDRVCCKGPRCQLPRFPFKGKGKGKGKRSPQLRVARIPSQCDCFDSAVWIPIAHRGSLIQHPTVQINPDPLTSLINVLQFMQGDICQGGCYLSAEDASRKLWIGNIPEQAKWKDLQALVDEVAAVLVLLGKLVELSNAEFCLFG